VATVSKVKVIWSGLVAGGGVSTFYVDHASNPSPNLTALKAFFTAIKASTPAGITWSFPNSGVTIDVATGAANGTWTSSSVTNETSSAGTGSALPVGVVVNWRTGFYAGGRELRGRTFIVPVLSGAFGSDGRVTPTTQGTFSTAAETLRTTFSGMTIWSRHQGVIASPTSGVCPSLPAVLRSRRD